MVELRNLMLMAMLVCSTAAAAPVRTDHVTAELLSERTAVEPGKPFTVALRLRAIPHWHTYWRNPGDSGQPTTIEWTLPPGAAAGPIQWPFPSPLPIRHLMNFGYEDEVLLLTDVSMPAGLPGLLGIKARVSWLVCNEEHCIPEDAELSLVLPWGRGEATPDAAAIARARAALPVPAASIGAWRFDAKRGDGNVELAVVPPAGIAPAALRYFPYDEGRIHNAGAQTVVREGEGLRLAIPVSGQPTGAFTRVHGVLVADRPLREGGPQAIEVDVPVAPAAPAGSAPGLLFAIAFALVGGLILNLMPCVLPVLSIKVLGFASHASDTSPRAAREMRMHGVLYALGVLASFWLLAAAFAVLKSLGNEVGWGFQLQSPVFVALLALLFLALALNLSGVFEFGQFLPARVLAARSGDARAQSFLTGVLAVAIASPCTAPFMGAALGYTLAESAWTGFLVFTALGAGMAAPYVALAWHPRWLRWVPRPGVWMLRMKQVLAVPLYATVLWLGWVLAAQVGPVSPAPAASGPWQPYSAAKLDALAAAGQPAFVDFTAAWCVTCQVNKQLVLGQPDIEQAFGERGVALLRADWTRRDDEISRTLAALGRKGVPVYALYRPGREPQLLPEILTRESILAALDQFPRKEPKS